MEIVNDKIGLIFTQPGEPFVVVDIRRLSDEALKELSRLVEGEMLRRYVRDQ